VQASPGMQPSITGLAAGGDGITRGGATEITALAVAAMSAALVAASWPCWSTISLAGRVTIIVNTTAAPMRSR
jgi:hypothetical protein